MLYTSMFKSSKMFSEKNITVLRAQGGRGKALFSQLDFILKSFIQATRFFLHISKIQSNF